MTGTRHDHASPGALAPAGPVLAHIQWLLDQGACMAGIERAAGVSHAALWSLANGRTRQPTAATAAAVLAITDPAAARALPHPPGPGRTPGTPRTSIWADDLEMLADTGHTPDSVAARLGVRPGSITAWCRRHQRPDLWARLRANNGGARP